VRAEQDFAAYVAARGATVVRCLVLLGLSPVDAEQVAADAFATLRGEWADLSRYGDPDVSLYATMLGADARRRRRASLPSAEPARVAAVLRGVADLEEIRVCEVLGIPVSQLRTLLAAGPGAAELVDESDELPAIPVAYGRVLALVGRRRRRRWGLSVGVLAGAAALVATIVTVSRPEPPPRPGDALPAADVVEEANPAGVAWWADGTLHLADAAVEVGDVQRLVAAGTGAAYIDADGRLVGVTPDGRRTLLGRPVPRSAIVSSPRLGLVAWLDDVAPGGTRLVVWDVEEGKRVSGVVTGPRTRPITFDGGWLTFGTGLTDWAWDPAGGPARQTGSGYVENPNRRTALVDVVAGTRLEQFGYYLRVVRVGSQRRTSMPGFGGSLSADGRLVLTRANTEREPMLYDARTGERVDSWFPPQWHVLDATFTGTDRVTWLVARGDGLTLVTCGSTRDPAPCSDAADLGDARSVLLAGDSTR